MSDAIAGTKVEPKGRPLFFALMGGLGVAVVLIGFAKTFFTPVLAGTFHAPAIVYLHGACAFLWVLIFAGQPWWIRRDKFPVHRAAGIVAVAAALGFALTAVPVAVFAAHRDFANGGGETAISSVLGTLTSTLMFSALVAAGIATRNTPETHKRFMLLATIFVLWPAWFRFRHYFPQVPRPDIWFGVVVADSLIVVAAIRDWFAQGRVHPVWLYAGTALIAENFTEVLLFDTPTWQMLARALYDLF